MFCEHRCCSQLVYQCCFNAVYLYGYFFIIFFMMAKMTTKTIIAMKAMKINNDNDSNNNDENDNDNDNENDNRSESK